MEFVRDGYNGYILNDDPIILAQKIDALYQDRHLARTMGENGYVTLKEKNISWDYVIKKLIH